MMKCFLCNDKETKELPVTDIHIEKTYEPGKRFGELAGNALKQAIEQSLQEIEAMSQEMKMIDDEPQGLHFDVIYNGDGTCTFWDCGKQGVVLAYDAFSPQVAHWFCEGHWEEGDYEHSMIAVKDKRVPAPQQGSEEK